jgi:predicted nucleic acid-binding protein
MPILLDTVTVSELRCSERRMHPGVQMWQQGVGDSFISVITLNELRFGLRKVEPRDPVFAAQLMAWYAQILARPKNFRILNVDRAIAELAADLRVAHGTPFEDSLIAATAKVHNLTLATRNTADFKACGVDLVNPWEFPA